MKLNNNQFLFFLLLVLIFFACQNQDEGKKTPVNCDNEQSPIYQEFLKDIETEEIKSRIDNYRGFIEQQKKNQEISNECLSSIRKKYNSWLVSLDLVPVLDIETNLYGYKLETAKSEIDSWIIFAKYEKAEPFIKVNAFVIENGQEKIIYRDGETQIRKK